MTPEKIWEILERTCGAGSSWRENFISLATEYLASGQSLEYRFQGNLGFGGKVWLNNGPHPYVTCYPEDMTEDKKRMIGRANAELGGRTVQEKVAKGVPDAWVRRFLADHVPGTIFRLRNVQNYIAERGGPAIGETSLRNNIAVLCEQVGKGQFRKKI